MKIKTVDGYDINLKEDVILFQIEGALNMLPGDHSTGGTYINFLTEDEGPERIEAALGDGIQRRAGVKAKWDPENVFRTNRNIKPILEKIP
jgi:hypothetical protein